MFSLGKVVATPGALEALSRSAQSPGEFLTKHRRGEWGDLDASDTAANRTALQTGGRILSSYRTHGKRTSIAGKPKEFGEEVHVPAGPLALDLE
jgi:hypothetical protein